VHSRRGQALVEFALVMPLFLALMFGLAEVSLIYGAAALYSNAAEQGARVASLAENRSSGSDAQAVATVLRLVQSYFPAHVAQIEIFQSDAHGDGPQTTSENVFDATGNPIPPQTWPISSRMGTIAAPLYLGLRITYHYTWITSFIGVAGATLTLRTTAIMPIAPMGG
jgi:hypothetical protein